MQTAGKNFSVTLLNRALSLAAVVVGCFSFAPQASSADMVRVAAGNRGNWEQSVTELGKRKGIFAKHGLDLDILYTQGSGETQQAVISGSVDIGLGLGFGSIMGAFAKGAPVRIISNAMRGGFDVYWYVPVASPIKSFKDAEGKTVGYSTNGSSTNIMALGLISEAKVNAKIVATGSPSSTFAQTMSGQIDIGWSSPPFGVDAIEQGKIRVVARGSDVPSFRTQTLRVHVTNKGFLDSKPDVVNRFMKAYRETLDWMYANDEALGMYSEWLSIPISIASRTRSEFFPKDNQLTTMISDSDLAMKDAVTYKFLAAPLTEAQLSELIKIPK